MMFSKSIGSKDSNEVELWAILEALLFYFSFWFTIRSLLLKMTRDTRLLQLFGFWLLLEALGSSISFLMRSRVKSSSTQVEFCHILHSANDIANTSAKQG